MDFLVESFCKACDWQVETDRRFKKVVRIFKVAILTKIHCLNFSTTIDISLKKKITTLQIYDFQFLFEKQVFVLNILPLQVLFHF